MHRSLAWGLAAAMLAAAVWIASSTWDGTRPEALRAARGPSDPAVAARVEGTDAGAERRAAALREGDAVDPAIADGGSPVAPVRDAGPDPEHDPRRALRSLLEATSGAGAGRAAPGDAEAADARRVRPSEGDEPDPDFAEQKENAAKLAEQLNLISPQDLEGRIQREIRRCRCDYETAKTTVLSDWLLLYQLAKDKLGPDATNQEIQQAMDAGGLPGSLLPPEKKAQKWRDAGA